MDELEERATRLVENFPYVMKAFHRIKNDAVIDTEITLSQAHLLSALFVHKQLTLSELADFIGVKSPAASELVERMVKAGWIERTTNPEDRRQTFLTLSEMGQSFLERKRVAQVASFTVMLSKLSPTYQKKLERAITDLAQIAQIMEKQGLNK